MKYFYLICVLVFCLSGCAEEVQPYEESNLTNPNSNETGYIQTH